MAEVPEGQAGPFPAYSAQNRYTGIRQSPTGISNKPASILRQTWSGDRRDTDPSQKVRGMPPNFGEGALPHVITFQGIISSVARVYRPSDEAIKDSYDNARFMRNSPDVMECVENRQRSTALLDWHLEPDDAKDATQVQLCEDLTAIVEQIPRFMQMRENLLHALWYGRYATQFRYRWKKVRGNMRLVIDRWLPVNGDKLVFRYDDGTMEHNPDQIGVRVGAGFTTGNSVAKQWHVERINKVEPTDYGLAYFFETWERSLLAIHRHMIEDGEYEDPRSAGKIHGVGIRSRIYWAWYQKQETLAFMMEFLERSASGMEIWYYPWGNPEAEAVTRKAAEERIGTGRNIILVPRPLGQEGDNYGVERIEPSMAGVDALQHVVTEYFGHMIKRYILGQTLTTEAESTGLGSNLASVHLDTFLQIVKYDATNLEETLTTDLIEPLKRYNFPKYADIPVKFRIDTESPDVEGKLKAWREAYEMGLKLKSQDVMDLIGAAKPDDSDETLQSPEHQQAQMQIDAQQQQQAAMEQQAAAAQQTQVAMPSNPEADEVWKALEAQKVYDQLAQAGMTDDQFAKDGTALSENSEREKLGTYSKQKMLWNEEEHPRDDEGKFSEGGEGGVATAEPPITKPSVSPEFKQRQADRKTYDDLRQSIKRLRQFQEDVETGKKTKKQVEKELGKAGYKYSDIARMIKTLSDEQAELNQRLKPTTPPQEQSKGEGKLAQQFAREFASRDKYIIERGENYASCYARGWEESKQPTSETPEISP